MSFVDLRPEIKRLGRLREAIVLDMHARIASAPVLNIGIISGAVLISCVAVAAMVGWFVQSVSLVQIFPGLVPMQFNTALGFLLCGIALASGVFQASRVALIAAGLVFMIGVLTLAEYAFGVNIGLDELFVTHFTSEQTLYRGRMAISTASSFSLAGTSLIFLNWPARTTWRPVIIACAGSIVLGIGIVSHIGYIGSTDYSYGWGIFSRMAIHTAAGFEVVGACLVALAWRKTQEATNRTPEWLAIPVGVSVATVAFVLWQALAIDEDLKVERSIFIRSDSAAIKIENQFTQSAQALIRMALRWEIEGGTSRDTWDVDALNYVDSNLALDAIAVVDRSLRVQWVSPDNAASQLQNQTLALNPEQRIALETAIENRAVIDTGPVVTSQTIGTVNILIPVFSSNGFDGLILGELNLDALLHPVADELDGLGYVLALHENDERVYFSPNGEERVDQWERAVDIEIQGKSWQMTIWPTETRISELKTNIPVIALSMGLFMAAITAIGVNQAQTAISRARVIADTNKELQEAKSSLEIEVVERKRAEESLILKTNDLQRSNSELERFAYVASHDLQTPIRTVVGFSQVLAEDYQGKLGAEADDVIRRIVDAGAYMQDLINDLLEYSRVGANFTEAEDINTEVLVKKQIAMFESAIRDSGTTVEHASLPIVRGERTMLDQVFRNLISNALKYRNKHPNQVNISARMEENEWVFEVEDNGIGIEAQYLERIFGVFQRLHLREQYEGTGIGLAICKKAVEGLGGRIWVESVPGQGSKFSFTIPIVSPKSSQILPETGVDGQWPRNDFMV